ncbi:hypothetical protein ACWOFR_09750 [Carnobacterium gallinarum]|uniref:hypothetical protein n=1 Tax=Carnobacterium gallinarum TaxID=2749 RepID=UPI00054CE199|nr:hypothetical protein [Carnobacterium gallinarum]
MYLADVSSVAAMEKFSDLIIQGVVVETEVVDAAELETIVSILVRNIYKGDKNLVGNIVQEKELGAIVTKEEWLKRNPETEVAVDYVVDAPNHETPSIVGQEIVIFLIKLEEGYFAYSGNSSIFYLNKQTNAYEQSDKAGTDFSDQEFNQQLAQFILDRK